MVCDVDLLLNQQDVFKLIVDRGYPIVIPSNGMSLRALPGVISTLQLRNLISD